MGRLTQVLVQIIGLASLTTACGDVDDGVCYGNVPGSSYDVVITGAGEGGAAGAGGAGAGGAAEVDCSEFCDTPLCSITQDFAGQTVARCSTLPSSPAVACPPPGVSIGRRPEQLLAPQHAAADDAALGALFARLAHLEAASVHAFARLRRELRAHGASEAVLGSVKRAARDEVRHARQMAALARSYGASAPRVELGAFRVRALSDIAHENEVEGCVRETYGALLTLWQAGHAGAPELRALFQGIARDEARHAELSWQLRDWFRARLGPEELRQLDLAHDDAIAALADEVAVAVPATWRDVAGLPDPSTARQLLGLLIERLPRPARSTTL